MKNFERKKQNPVFEVQKNCRLFDFLREHMMGKSRNNIKSILSKHFVLVNGAPVSQFDFEVVEGDSVEISANAQKKNTKQQKKLSFLYEDDELIVLDKPSGLLSVATDKEKVTTAYRLVLDYVREKDPKKRIFVVHRIDKDTSGVLLFSKSEKLKNALQENWNLLVKDRMYIAITEGIFEKKEGTRTSWLLETKTNMVYSSSHKGDGVKATTHYKVLKEKKDYSMVEVHIDTGRKNQIRVHMKDLNHPVIGDEKYAQNDSPIQRLGLHAKKLILQHPFTKELMVFESPLPKEFNQLFDEKSSSPQKVKKSFEKKFTKKRH